MQEELPEYRAFVEKFKPKKTTDDCYTPAPVYDAVADWVAAEYGLNRANFVRPFWPGADYQRLEYKPDDIVVDNPPFSIITQIVRWYCANNVQFFLFAPTLTLFRSMAGPVCFLPTGAPIIYENGANVNTSFITNLDPARVRISSSLYSAVQRSNKENLNRKQQTKQIIPHEVITSATIYSLAKYGIDIQIMPEECTFINSLDSQRKAGKSLFGGGFLLSENATERIKEARERADKEREAKTWVLSGREKAIVQMLGRRVDP